MVTKPKAMRRAFVSLPDGVWKIIDENLRDQMGEGDSEVIRNIVISYLSDNGYFISDKSTGEVTDVNERLFVFENMITSLVDLLEEKGGISYSEWENRMRRKITDAAAQRPRPNKT